jgi:hypothetical protein
MALIFEWLKRIIRIGIWEFLHKIGLKALLSLLGVVIGLVILVVILIVLVIILL